MAQPTIQTSFASGEWAPKLRSRVDIQKYHSGASLLRNFFVDYSGGGASTRPGTEYIATCFTNSTAVRLIPFQPSTDLSYVLEFGQNYIRFYSNGEQILGAATTGGTAASGNTFTINNSFSLGEWVYASGWDGLDNVNGNTYIIAGITSSEVAVTDTFGNAVTFVGTYTGGGSLAPIYQISTPYNAADLFPNQQAGNPGLKYVQDVTSMILCHPSYPPQILTINSANNWTLAAVTIGPTIGAPTGVTCTLQGTGSGTWQYAYAVTAVDTNGQESPISLPGVYSSGTIYISPSGTVTMAVTWTGVAGAVSYNVYKAPPSIGDAVASGMIYGFMGNVTGTTFQDNGSISPDFSQTPPIAQDPFVGGSVQSLTLTANAGYSTVPSLTIAAPSSGLQATGYVSLGINSAASDGLIVNSASGGAQVNPEGAVLYYSNGVSIGITAATFTGVSWDITGVKIVNAGSLTGVGNSAPSALVVPSGSSTGIIGYVSGQINVTWDISSLILAQGGYGYTSAPAVTISGGATATSTLGSVSGGNPGVPSFLQERLMFAGQSNSPQSFNFSQPASFFNFNISNPSEADDAISGSIISDELNDIRWAIPVPTGIILGTGKGAWLINGGGGLSTINPITPSNIVAQPQAFNGANDLKPQKVNFDVIYGTNKGSYFRDLTYNIYANIYTGQDISVLSNHLFFGYFFIDVAWAEEPFKTMWFVRNDGIMLSLAFVKEQDLIGWAHHDTNGIFSSVCSVIETTANGVVDAVYVVTGRNSPAGGGTQLIERMADRYFPYGYEDSWCVDAALQTQPFTDSTVTGALLSGTGSVAVGSQINFTLTNDNAGFSDATVGASIRSAGGIFLITSVQSASQFTATVTRQPTMYNPVDDTLFFDQPWSIYALVTEVYGLQHLAGQSVVGVGDGTALGPLTVAAGGSVTLPAAYGKVTLGLQIEPDLVTLPLDLGEPTAQSKRKKLPAVTLRVADTLGLQVGTSFSNMVTVKDFQIGAIPSGSNGVYKVTDLVNISNVFQTQQIDGRQYLDQLWQEPGVLYISQNLPYPATILGIMPEVTVGDTPK